MSLVQALMNAYGTAVVMAAREIDPGCPDFKTALRILPKEVFESLRSSYAKQIDHVLHGQTPPSKNRSAEDPGAPGPG